MGGFIGAKGCTGVTRWEHGGEQEVRWPGHGEREVELVVPGRVSDWLSRVM